MKTKIYNGDLIVKENETLSVDYTEITGYVDLRDGSSLQAAQLTTIGGDVYLRGATLQAAQLTTIGGYVDIREGGTLQADQLTTIGGNVDIRGATLQADQLTTIGGYVDISKDATYSPKNAVQDKEKAHEICNKLKRNGFETPDGKYIIADGIVTEIVSHKANVYRVRKIARKEIEYLITDGNGNYAHGATLAATKEDLIYKVTDRKKSDYEHLTTNDTLTHEEAVKCYRVVTGACSSGTRHFVESILNGNRKDKYTIAEIIELTQGQYGSDAFKAFFIK